MSIDPTYVLTGVITLLIYFIKKWIGGVETSVNRIGSEVNNIKLTLAVQEAKIADGKELRDNLEKIKHDFVILDSQMKAAWKAIDRIQHNDIKNVMR